MPKYQVLSWANFENASSGCICQIPLSVGGPYLASIFRMPEPSSGSDPDKVVVEVSSEYTASYIVSSA
jgi:hypothetical protein